MSGEKGPIHKMRQSLGEIRNEPALDVKLVTNPTLQEIAAHLAKPIDWDELKEHIRQHISPNQLSRLPKNPGFFVEALVDMKLEQMIADGRQIEVRPIPLGTHTSNFVFLKKETGQFGTYVAGHLARFWKERRAVHHAEYDMVARVEGTLGVIEATVTGDPNKLNKAVRNNHINRIFKPLQEHAGLAPFFYMLIGTKNTVHGQGPQETFLENGGILVQLTEASDEYMQHATDFGQQLNQRYFGIPG